MNELAVYVTVQSIKVYLDPVAFFGDHLKLFKGCYHGDSFITHVCIHIRVICRVYTYPGSLGKGRLHDLEQCGTHRRGGTINSVHGEQIPRIPLLDRDYFSKGDNDSVTIYLHHISVTILR